MRSRDLKNKQKVFEKTAEFLVFTPEDQIAKEDYYDSNGNVCALGSLMSERALKLIRKGNDSNKIVNKALDQISYYTEYQFGDFGREIATINDHIKRSRRPQKLRALAKKHGLKIPEWLQKKDLGY